MPPGAVLTPPLGCSLVIDNWVQVLPAGLVQVMPLGRAAIDTIMTMPGLAPMGRLMVSAPGVPLVGRPVLMPEDEPWKTTAACSPLGVNASISAHSNNSKRRYGAKIRWLKVIV